MVMNFAWNLRKDSFFVFDGEEEEEEEDGEEEDVDACWASFNRDGTKIPTRIRRRPRIRLIALGI